MVKLSIRPRDSKDIISAGPKQFLLDGQDPIPGVGLFVGRYLVQFLTPAQALTLANQLTEASQHTQNGVPNAQEVDQLTQYPPRPKA